MQFTIQQLEDLKAKKLIRDYSTGKKNTTSKTKTVKKGSKIKEWIAIVLGKWCYANGLQLWHSGNERGEYRFHPERKWRFDFAVFRGDEKICAIEYEGLMSAKSRHTTRTGYTGDTDKYREASLMGWKVLRYTAINYKQLENDLGKLI